MSNVQLAKQMGITVVAKSNDGTELPIKFNPVLNKSGKATKLVAAFAPVAPGEGDGSARALKAYFRSTNPTWSNKDVRDAVQKSLRDGSSVREVAALALHTAFIKGGALPDYSQMNLKGDHAAIHYTMAGRETPDAATKKLSKTESALAAQKAENERLAKELADLKAMVAGLLPAAPAAAPESAPACMSDEELARRPIAPVPACA